MKAKGCNPGTTGFKKNLYFFMEMSGVAARAMDRYRSLSAYFRERFGGRVQKIPLDAGFTCPNRDGTLSRRGCVFCNPRGSGSGLRGRGLSLAGQWEYWQERLARKYKTGRFIAYLQSFSNTHGPAEKLARVLEEIAPLPGLAGLAVGTRPDCLDAEKLALLSAFPSEETWLELGLQSAHDPTLARINRGHDAQAFAQACRSAAQSGLKVCAHVIAGLPNENPAHFLHTIDFLNALPISGIKLHNLYVCQGSPLAEQWRQGLYLPLEREAYLFDWLIPALQRLRPDIVIQRLTGDPAPGELLAPAWCSDKSAFLNLLHAALEAGDVRQGMEWDG